MGMGCGNPVALAELKEGQVVLDLGAGGGLDAFLAARKVAPSGKVIGVDMTEAAVQKARRFAREGGFDNVEFRVGLLEKLPVEDESIDVVISNCVMNHAADKTAAFQEALRVLKGGGRMCVSDLVLKGKLPAADTPGLEVWSGWLEVACGKHDYLKAILDAGFKRVMVVAEALYTGAAMTAALAGKIVSLHVQAKR
jgi:SAM-dependent methyltransferase